MDEEEQPAQIEVEFWGGFREFLFEVDKVESLLENRLLHEVF